MQRRTISELRESLLSGGDLNQMGDMVRQPIRDSWLRSMSASVDADVHELPTAAVFEIEQDERLVRAALPVLQALAADLDGMPGSLQLGNEAGTVMRAWALDSNSRLVAERIGLVPGASVAEGLIGTNGLGTAVAQGRPVQVVGGEHFASGMTEFACTAVPLLDPWTGEVTGAINLSCLPSALTPLVVTSARLAVNAIESRLRADGTSVNQRLLAEFERASGPGRSRVLAIGGDLRISRGMTDEEAARLAGVTAEYLDGLMGRGDRAVATLKGADGRETSIEVTRVGDPGSPAGFLVSLPARTGSLGELPADAPASGRARVTADMARARVNAIHVLVGEPGAGKSTQLRGMHGQLDARRELLLLDVRQFEDSAAWWSAVFSAATRRSKAVALLHLDDLADAEVEREAQTLTLLMSKATRLGFATLTDLPRAGSALAVLLEGMTCQFHAVPAARDRDLSEFCHASLTRLGEGRRSWDPDALHAMTRYYWPGNLRELLEVVRRVALQGEGPVLVQDLPQHLRRFATPGPTLDRERAEAVLILEELARHRGSRTLAAKALGMSRSTLYRKIRHHRLGEARAVPK